MIAHLVNTDVGSRGGIGRLYLDYRTRNFHFLEDAAETFLNNLERTLIVTGFPIPPSMTPETDGPPGGAGSRKSRRKARGKGGSPQLSGGNGSIEAVWRHFCKGR